MQRTSILIVLAAFFLVAPAHAEDLGPRNECSALPGADGFYAQLATAVANRNAEMLKPLVDPQITLDFGGGAGWAEMRERLDSPDYRLWDELDAVIRLGCAVGYDSSIAMPYYWAQDFGEMDGYSTFIAMGDRVPLYADASGEVIARYLDWQAVELLSSFETADELEEAQRWEVKLSDGSQGFVNPAQLRALVDYRLLAERRNDRWQITYLVAGD